MLKKVDKDLLAKEESESNMNYATAAALASLEPLLPDAIANQIAAGEVIHRHQVGVHALAGVEPFFLAAVCRQGGSFLVVH